MKNIAHQLFENYNQAPEQKILHLLYNRQPDQTFTSTQLLQGAIGYARALREGGIEAGEVVILILQHSPDLLFAFFGAILHGAIPSIMPFLTEKLSPEQYRNSLSALFQITAPAAVITYPDFEAEVQQAIFATPTQGPHPVRKVFLNTHISPVEQVDRADLAGLNSSSAEIVLLQHSSGTTGLQKGVALSHQAVFNQLDSYAKSICLSEEDVIVSWLPLYHDMGLIAGFLMPIMLRIPLVLMSPFDWIRAPHRLFQAVSQYKGTLSWLPNFAYNFCAQKIRDRDLEGVDLSCWRAVINCSEPMLYKSHQMFLERFRNYGFRPQALATCYAMAENVFAVTQGGIHTPVTVDRISQQAYFSARLAQPASDHEPFIAMLSAGKPIEGTRVKIVNDHRKELPDRQIGEIALQSNCMLTGYYHRPDATAKAFHQGWYLTGDLGYIADGEVYVTGRKKDLIIVGGKNIYPQDLEILAGEVPGIHPGRTVAFGLPNEETGTEDVVLLAEAERELAASQKEELENHIRQVVTRGSDVALRYAKVVERGWLLKTSSGKIARSANRDKYRQAFLNTTQEED
jgi:acyl-CoA synthetase (AMP-forming)/AMP-acid ligase II